MSARRDVQLAPRALALKMAFRALVEGCGGVEAAAQFCRVGKTKLSDYCSPNTDSFAALDVVADLEEVARRASDWPPVTRALAQRHGFVLVALPPVDARACHYLKIIARILKEGGEVASALDWALNDDDDVSRTEARRVLPEVWDLISAATGLAARLESVAASE